MERYLETAALRNDLTLKEVTLLLYLSQTDTPNTRKDLADLSGMSKNGLSLTSERLSSKNYVKITTATDTATKSSRRTFQVELLPSALTLLPQLQTVLVDFDAARFDGFTETEYEEYCRLSAKMKNISVF